MRSEEFFLFMVVVRLGAEALFAARCTSRRFDRNVHMGMK